MAAHYWRRMARPVEFDRAEALEAAMRLFWAQGYMATSLSELLVAMGVGRSSFYAAFGSKRSIFVEALGLFSARTSQMLMGSRESAADLAAISDFFCKTLLDAPSRRVIRGCLMVNTVLEMAEVDEELSAIAADGLAQVERLFERCFEKAQGSGEYPGQRSASDLAAHVMVLNQGLRVASRKRVQRADLKKSVETGLSLLGLPTTH